MTDARDESSFLEQHLAKTAIARDSGEKALDRHDARKSAGADDAPEMDRARSAGGEPLPENVPTGYQPGRMVLGCRNRTSVLHHAVHAR
jgi:hypothetical protein